MATGIISERLNQPLWNYTAVFPLIIDELPRALQRPWS